MHLHHTGMYLKAKQRITCYVEKHIAEFPMDWQKLLNAELCKASLISQFVDVTLFKRFRNYLLMPWYMVVL